MNLGEPNLGEQTLSKVAEMGISSQLDEVEQLNVDIRTDPLKLLQGKVDSVTIEGEGMVMQESLRMESIQVSTGNVAINPMSALGGKIELTEPAAADARVVLTEEDMNRAFQSDFILDKMKDLQVEVNGKPVAFDIEAAEIHLLGDRSIHFTAEVKRHDTGEPGKLSASAFPKVADGGHRIGLEVKDIDDQNSAPELTMAVLKKMMEVADLRNFDLSGIELKLRSLHVQEGKLILDSETQIEQIPSV